ncbi:hypothetical protein PInf_000195 [Phytophthora infestans]|nr:hypothetical protein PInf_000195 [Phytophthora infestans]
MAGGSVFHVGEDVALYQVVVVLNALAICLLIFEAALHHLEHHVLAHNDKYQHMVKKVYRELMILGLLSFIIKILTEVGGIDGYSGTMLAFQAFSAVEQILGDFEVEMRYELIETLMAFAWALVVFHIFVMLYFRFCLRRLLSVAGSSKDKSVLAVNLSKIANEEANAWQNEAAESALDAMIRTHEQHEEMEHERRARRRGILKDDVGFQLVATCFRHVSRALSSKKHPEPRQTGVMPGSPDIHLPLFSRKAWHVAVMFMMILNGFFVALLVMGAVYCFDEIYHQVGIFPVILIPVPLVLNSPIFLKSIFRDFVLICSILHIDASTLGEVVGHFSETVELRSEFASSLLQCLKRSGHSIADLDKALQSHDLHSSGFIDVDKLRTVLASFGFHLARFRLNSVVKLLFELQGTSVEYAQLVQLVTLIQQEYCAEESFQDLRPSHQRAMTVFDETDRRRQLPLLAQTSLPQEPGPSDFVFTSATTPPLGRLRHESGGPIRSDENFARQSIRRRSVSRQFAPSSSRVLHGVYNLQLSLTSPHSPDITSSVQQ